MTKKERRKQVLCQYHDAWLEHIFRTLDFRKKRFKDLKEELECKTNEECIKVIGNELCERGVCKKRWLN